MNNKLLNKFEIIKILLHHRRVAEQRNLDSTKNRFARAMVYFSVGVVITYLMLIAVGFSLAINGSRTTTAIEFICSILPFVLAIDFGMRFIAQQTPSQIIKPYSLLPLPRNICVDAFILSSIINWGNFIWFAFFVPFMLMSVVFSYGLISTFFTLLFILFLILANSQWYAIVRTLVNNSVRWWILPLVVYAIIALPLYCHGIDFDNFLDFYSLPGYAIGCHNILPVIAATITFIVITSINKKIQCSCVERELVKTERETPVENVKKYTFLDRFGELGAFLQLEIKLTLRNKSPRKTLIFDSVGIVFISLIVISSDIYDSLIMTNFWGLYNFALYGSTIIVRIMSFEGNYIDGLMVRKENILSILKAKYIIMSALLIVPFTLMLPVVIFGKWSFFMLVSYAVFTMGFQYCILFQMAVYNKTTVPLNTKFTSKGGIDGNYFQSIIIGVIMIVPNVIATGLETLFSANVAYTVLLIIGLVFILTHNWWLRNVYNRLMERRYVNMEGFRSSR